MKRRINKKGFTIVELLAVVVIIGVIGTIAIVGVNSVIKRSHEKYNLAQAKLFVAAAQTYFSDHKSRLPVRTFTQTTVTLNELIEENYIDQIVDYKKEPYDVYKSYASATKMGAGQYAYDGELITKDGERAKYKEHKNDNGSIIFKNEGSTFTSELYTNNEKEIEIVMSDSDTIAGYIVSIYKNNKKVEDLEYKEIGNSTSASTKVKLSKNIYKDGKYKIRVKLIDIYNNQKTADSNYITLDTIKPECSITLTGTKGNNDWYKQGDLTVNLNVKEINKFKYRLYTSGAPSYSDHNGTTKLEKIYTKKQEVNTPANGTKWIASVKDLAGNECKVEKIVYYDKDPPKCTLGRIGTYWPGPEEAGWFWLNSAISYQIIDDGSSGIDFSNSASNPNKINSSRITSNQGKIPQTNSSGPEGTPYVCHVEDKAGNINNSLITLKVDVTPPQASVTYHYDDSKCPTKAEIDAKDDDGNYIISTAMDVNYSTGPSGAIGLRRYRCYKTDTGNYDNCFYDPPEDSPNSNITISLTGDTSGVYPTGRYSGIQDDLVTYTVVDRLGRESPITSWVHVCIKGSGELKVKAQMNNHRGTGQVSEDRTIKNDIGWSCSFNGNIKAGTNLTAKLKISKTKNGTASEETITETRNWGTIFGEAGTKYDLKLTCSGIGVNDKEKTDKLNRTYYCYETNSDSIGKYTNCLTEDNCRDCSTTCHNQFFTKVDKIENAKKISNGCDSSFLVDDD